MRRMIGLALCCLLLTGCTQVPAQPPENGVSRMPLRAILHQLLEQSELNLGSLFTAVEPTREEVAYAIGADEFTQPYSEALLYGPAVGLSAFELLLFRLQPGADAQAFAEALRTAANCDHWAYLHADFADTAVNGQIVLFLMADLAICPGETRAAVQSAFAAIDPLAYDPADYVSAAKPVVLAGDVSMAELLSKVAGDCLWEETAGYRALSDHALLAELDTADVADSAVYAGSRGLCGLVQLKTDAALPGFTATLHALLCRTARSDTVLVVFGNQLVGFCRAPAPEAYAATNSMIRRFALSDYEKNFAQTR